MKKFIIITLLLLSATALYSQVNPKIVKDYLTFPTLVSATVNNSSFANGFNNWTATQFWTSSGSKAIIRSTASGSTDSSSAKQVNVVTVGKTYQVTSKLDTMEGGTYQVHLGTASGTVRDTAGTFVDTIVCAGNGNLILEVNKTSGIVGYIDSIAVKEILTNTDDIIDLGNYYTYANITATDSGASLTDTIQVRAGIISGNDTVWTPLAVKDSVGDYKNYIITANATSSWFISRPYIRLLRLSFANAQIVANRRWDYVVEATK